MNVTKIQTHAKCIRRIKPRSHTRSSITCSHFNHENQPHSWSSILFKIQKSFISTTTATAQDTVVIRADPRRCTRNSSILYCSAKKVFPRNNNITNSSLKYPNAYIHTRHFTRSSLNMAQINNHDPNLGSTTTSSTPHTEPPEAGFMPDYSSLDPSVNYWKEYQDRVNRKMEITDLDLGRLLGWLRTKDLTRDTASKMEKIMKEMDKRHIGFDLDAYNDLIYMNILRGKFQDAKSTLEKLQHAKSILETTTKKNLKKATSQRMYALQIALYLKNGDNEALKVTLEGKKDKLMQYMEQFLRWTKGLQLTRDHIEQVRTRFYNLQIENCRPNSKRFTSLLDSLFKANKPKEALAIINHVIDIGFKVESIALSATISGLLNAKLFDDAVTIWERVSNQGDIKSDIVILNPILSALSTNPKHFPLAVDLWENLLQDAQVKPNNISFSSMLRGYFGTRNSVRALELWNDMQKSPFWIKPDAILYNVMISGLFNTHEPRKAKEFFEEMTKAKNIKMSLESYNIMIRGLTSIQDRSGLKTILDQMEKSGLSPDSKTYTSIVDTLFSQGDEKSALKVTNLMTELGIPMTEITYSAMVAGFVNVGQWEQAKNVFRKMEESELTPSIHTYGAMMQGALKAGEVDVAEDMAMQAKSRLKEGMSSAAYLIMISGYSQLLMLDKAEHWLLEQKKKNSDSISWKSYFVLLKACVDHKQWEHAERVLDIMKESQFQSIIPKLNTLIESVEHARLTGLGQASELENPSFANRN